MADEQNKTTARHQGQPSNKHADKRLNKDLARRDRQAQSLRENLARRKAQARIRTKGDTSETPTEGDRG